MDNKDTPRRETSRQACIHDALPVCKLHFTGFYSLLFWHSMNCKFSPLGQDAIKVHKLWIAVTSLAFWKIALNKVAPAMIFINTHFNLLPLDTLKLATKSIFLWKVVIFLQLQENTPDFLHVNMYLSFSVKKWAMAHVLNWKMSGKFTLLFYFPQNHEWKNFR